MRERKAGKDIVGRGRDGRSEGCWVEGGGWILAPMGHRNLQSRDSPSLASLCRHRGWPPSRVLGRPVWQLGTASCKTSVRVYLHLIYIQVCQSISWGLTRVFLFLHPPPVCLSLTVLETLRWAKDSWFPTRASWGVTLSAREPPAWLFCADFYPY